MASSTTVVGRIKVDASLDSANFNKGAAEVENTGQKLVSGIGNKFKDLVKVATTAGTAIGAGIAGGAVKAFADYEQLVGGVNKLFGDAAGTVTASAESAFSRMQISANDYMETVTGFSASLISGLNGDTAAAAKIADTAIMDMADNANTFGTSMDMLQYTYQGFAKQNYTMLDNLKLGYGGTASEMARLVNDSGVLGDSFEATAENINSVSFDKIIEAIHTIQERMNIAGTSSREASGTVEGSFNQMKAAAGNFLAALGGGGDADEAFKELATSAQTFMENLVPVVQKVVDNILNIVSNIWNDFKENHPVISGLIMSLSVLIGTLLIPKLLTVVAQTVLAGANALIAGAQMLAGWMMSLGPIGLVVAGITGIIAVIAVLWNNFEGFRDFMKGAIDAIAGFFQGLWNGLTSAANSVASAISGTFGSMVNWIKSNVIDPIAGFFSGLWNGITSGLSSIGGGIKSGMDSVVGFIKAPINAIINGINSVIDKINSIKVPDWVPGIGGSHTSFGHIPTLASGGLVRGVGTATSDSNLAALSKGEYVVQASTVKDFGVDFMDALNAGQLPSSSKPGTMITNNYYQFDQQANNRWMYEQLRTGAAA